MSSVDRVVEEAHVLLEIEGVLEARRAKVPRHRAREVFEIRMMSSVDRVVQEAHVHLAGVRKGKTN
eukprot:12758620-Heterocapsa_arctica.AAC.1